MDKKDGQKHARANGMCLKIVRGQTCIRALKGGKCPKHGGDVYTPMVQDR